MVAERTDGAGVTDDAATDGVGDAEDSRRSSSHASVHSARNGTTGVRYGPPAGVPCSLCSGATRGDDVMVVVRYSPGEGDGDDAGDGGDVGDRDDAGNGDDAGDAARVACRDCGNEVAELLEAWTPLAGLDVSADRPIGAAYEAVADDCGFCGDALAERRVTGVECYRAGDAYDGGLGTHRDYALCPSCAGVFAQFLTDVGAGRNGGDDDGQ